MPLYRSASHWGAFSVQVENGQIEAIIPFEHDPSPNEMIQSWKEMATSPNRVARPSVRQGWLDKDGGAGRGQDRFVELPWDEALDMAAAEIKGVIRDHGNPAIFGGSYGWASAGRLHHARTLLHRFLNSVGGFTGQVTNYSYGAAMAFLPFVLGSHEAVTANVTEFGTIAAEGEVLLAFGGLAKKNWEVLSGGFGVHSYADQMQALAASRVRVVNISPQKGDCDPGVGADWLPIRPNSDTALILACITQLLQDGSADRAFLDRYTQGFERLEAWLTGAVDGTAKDATWAAALTGIPATEITALARSLPGKRIMVSLAWSLQRARHGEMSFWAAIALAAALGQIGLPGGGISFGYGSMNSTGAPRYRTPLSGPDAGDASRNLVIPVARVADLIQNPGKTIRYAGRDITYPEIQMIYWAGGNPFHHHQDLKQLSQAFRKVRSVIVHEQFWNATARHADIVLPATTSLERSDIGGSSRDPYLMAMQQAIAPVGAARNDFDIFAALAQRISGDDHLFTAGRDEQAWLRHIWAQSQRSLGQRGITAPDFDAFWQQGYFHLPTPAERYVYLADFRADPVAHALQTPSGRIEIFSAAVAAEGLADQPGHPCWIDPEEWGGGERAARYPLHLLTPQPTRKLHSQFEGSAYTAAIKQDGRERAQLHPADAEARGIAEGDAIRLRNDRGTCLAVAQLNPDLRQGVVILPTGADYEPDAAGNDRNSNPNVLTRDIGTSELGQGCAAQSCLIEVEKLQGALPSLTGAKPALV